jgi:hypothetical protein
MVQYTTERFHIAGNDGKGAPYATYSSHTTASTAPLVSHAHVGDDGVDRVAAHLADQMAFKTFVSGEPSAATRSLTQQTFRGYSVSA